MSDRAPTRKMAPEEHAALSRPTMPAADGPVHAVEALGRRCEELEKALRWALTERQTCKSRPSAICAISPPCHHLDPCRAAWALLEKTP